MSLTFDDAGWARVYDNIWLWTQNEETYGLYHCDGDPEEGETHPRHLGQFQSVLSALAVAKNLHEILTGVPGAPRKTNLALSEEERAARIAIQDDPLFGTF